MDVIIDGIQATWTWTITTILPAPPYGVIRAMVTIVKGVSILRALWSPIPRIPAFLQHPINGLSPRTPSLSIPLIHLRHVVAIPTCRTIPIISVGL